MGRQASELTSSGQNTFAKRHPRDRSSLAKPLQSKHCFAGEATKADCFGAAHGAYVSGIRAAAEIRR